MALCGKMTPLSFTVTQCSRLEGVSPPQSLVHGVSKRTTTVDVAQCVIHKECVHTTHSTVCESLGSTSTV